MFHLFKYLLLALFLFTLFALFQSNGMITVELKFTIPFFAGWTSEPVSLNYLLFGFFCMGILFSALLGALRFRKIREEKKTLKKMRVEMDERSILSPPAMNLPGSPEEKQLPSLIE